MTRASRFSSLWRRYAALALLLSAPAAQVFAQEGPIRSPVENAANVINMIMAKVNGEPILLSEFEAEETNRLVVIRQQIPEAEVQAQLGDLRVLFLRGLIEQKLIQQRAEQLGITADPNQIDRAVSNIRQQQGIATEEQFDQALAALGMTMQELREQLGMQLRQQRLVYEEVERGIFVTDGEIQTYYEEHPEEFTSPEQVRLQQLVFPLEGSDPVQIRAQAAAALEDLRGGATMDEAASKYARAVHVAVSDSFIGTSDLIAEVGTVAGALPVDTLSEPVETALTIHILRVIERRQRDLQPLDQVSDAIRSRLTAEKNNKRMEDYVRELYARTDIDILDPRFERLETLLEAGTIAGETGTPQ